VVAATAINDLPLNGRNFNFLARLTAGVTEGQQEGRRLNANGWFAANGTRPAQNNLLLDGIDNNSNNVDFLNGAAYVLNPPVDAISEFKMQTSGFSAEFGRAGGAVLNATLKSGTNRIHGSAWEFVRNDKFDAADFFQDAAGIAKGEYRQNQFGATADGPIRKNKTFWFGDYEGLRTLRSQGAALSYTHSFSPTLINEARVGFNREHVVRGQPYSNDSTDIPAKFGIPGIPQIPGNGGLPYIGIGGLSQLGSAAWLASVRFSNTFQYTENLTKVYKKHTFKGGAEVQRISFPWVAPPYPLGDYSFGGGYTSIPNVGDGSTGRAQFLLSPTAATYPGGVNNLGGVSSVSASNWANQASYRNYYGAYFQDDWKVTPKLTLNLGLRWDFFGLVGDKYGAEANFVPGVPFSTAEYVIPTSRKSDTLSPSFTSLLAKDGIKLVYSSAYGNGVGTSQDTNFAPRFGFAYQATPKLVVRGGYGIYYGGFENRGGDNIGGNYPFQYTFAYSSPNSQTSTTFPDGQVATLDRGFLDMPLSPGLVQAQGLGLQGLEFNYITPYVQGINMTVQYELTPNDSFEIGYVASLSRHLEDGATGVNRVSEILPPGTSPIPYVPFPDFARNYIFLTTNGNADYHSLQAKYERRFAKGLDMLAAFTWGKTVTNAADMLSGGGVGAGRAPYLPNFGLQADMGYASFDIRKALSWSGTYQLPYGHGRQFGASANKMTEGILGGWSFNWIMTMDDGQPMTINCVAAGASNLGCYALLTGQPKYAGKHNVDQWMNPAAFADPPPATTIGQTDYTPLGGGNTPVIGPGFHRLDFSVFKEFKTSESTRLQFRAEFFNITNHPNFALPAYTNYKSTSTFGKITSTRDSPNDPRQIQFALKFYF